jgi:hypothetical protein
MTRRRLNEAVVAGSAHDVGAAALENAWMTRANLRHSAIRLMLVAGLAVLDGGAPAAAPADGVKVTILTGPTRSAVSQIFGPRLAQALPPAFSADVQVAPGSWENLEAVAADPSVVAFSQFDLYQRFVAERGLENVLEHYGSIPVCLFAAARIGSPLTLGLDGGMSAVALRTVDIGPTNGDTALTYELLQERVPAMRDLKVEHRGWSRALARLAQGDLDLFLFVEYPGAAAPLMRDVLDNPRVVLLDNVADVLGPVPLADTAPYVPTQASIAHGGWLDERYVGQTLCTSLGVVIHRDGDPQVLEAVVHAATNGVLLNDVESSWWQSLAGRFEGWFDQGRRWMISVLNEM